MDYVTNFNDDINSNMINAVLCAKSTDLKESASYHILVCFVPTPILPARTVMILPQLLMLRLWLLQC